MIKKKEYDRLQKEKSCKNQSRQKNSKYQIKGQQQEKKTTTP